MYGESRLRVRNGDNFFFLATGQLHMEETITRYLLATVYHIQYSKYIVHLEISQAYTYY